MIQIIAVVTTAYKSTSPIGFRGGSEQINYFFIIFTLRRWRCCCITASLSYFLWLVVGRYLTEAHNLGEPSSTLGFQQYSSVSEEIRKESE